MLLLPARAGQGRTKPPPGTRIDRRHRLAVGLEVAVLPVEGAGTVTQWYGRGAARAVLDSTCGWRRGSDGGPAIDFPAATAAKIAIAGLPDAPFLGPLTLIWRGTIDTGSGYRQFAGKHAGNGGVASPFEFRTDNAATPLLTLVVADASGNITFWVGPAVTLGVCRSYAVVRQKNGANYPVTFYVDGVPTTAAAQNWNGDTAGSGADLWIGRRPDGVTQMDGGLELFLAYSRALRPDEMAALAAAPYAPFVAAPANAWYSGAAGGGGGGGARSFVVIAA